MTETIPAKVASDSSPALRAYLHYLAWAQALAATAGSLFFSEVMGFLPCVLCWYQRILMYPLVLIITTGILLRDARLRFYALPLSMLGWGIGLYHSLLYYGAIPEEFHVCTSGIPCETRWIEWLGFVGIPQLSFTAFTVITLSLLWYKPTQEAEAQEDQATRDKPGRWLKPLSWFIVIAYLLVICVGIASRLAPEAQPPNAFGPGTSNLATPEPPATESASDTAFYSAGMITDGQQVFSRQCAVCHGPDALGVPNLGLPLIGSAFISQQSDDQLVEFIVTGRLASDPQNQTGMIMPGKGGNPALTEDEIMAVVAYLRSLDS